MEAPRAIRQAEVGAAKIMIERAEERFGIKPERLAANTAYGSAANLSSHSLGRRESGQPLLIAARCNLQAYESSRTYARTDAACRCHEVGGYARSALALL